MTAKPVNLNKAAREASQVISDAAAKATTAIADAALNATKLLATNAQEAAKVVNVKGADDHDLLVTLTTKVEGIKEDIKDLKDGTTAKIADHEMRINTLETEKTKTATLIAVTGAILSFLVGLLVWHLFQQ